MTDVDRREILALGGALLLAEATGATVANAEENKAKANPTPPPMPKDLPDAWTKAPTISLWPNKPPGSAGFTPQKLPADWPAVFVRNVAQPALHVFKPEKPNGQAILAVPGGAYWFVSVANEGVDLAKRLNNFGFTVFVLTYRLPGEGWTPRADVPLQDAQRAMRVIRSKASQYGINSETLSVLGFSAGGHLTATLATQHAEHVYEAVDAADKESTKPFSAGLIYPVITMKKEWTHEKSRDLLLGDHPSDAEVEHRCPELHVTEATPPSFIAHAMDDADVPVENSLMMMNALRAAKHPVEAHLFQEGHHAFSLGHPNTPSAYWTDLYRAWLMRLVATTSGQ